MQATRTIETTITPSRRGEACRTPYGELAIASFGITEQGRLRTSNEDSLLVAPVPDPGVPGRATGQLLVVADGVGGRSGGRIASTLAVRTIAEGSLLALGRLCVGGAPEPQQAFEALRALVRRADARLADEVAQQPHLEGMATTLTVALVVGHALFVAHAGDSRCYVLRGRRLRRLTTDQTAALELARLGIIESDVVADHPLRHVLANFVGIGAAKLAVQVAHTELAPGDTLLLCTDGLSDRVPSPTIAAILGASSTPEAACRELVARACQLGAHDDITAVVAQFSSPLEPAPDFARRPA
jgi:protein phosphatase